MARMIKRPHAGAGKDHGARSTSRQSTPSAGTAKNELEEEHLSIRFSIKTGVIALSAGIVTLVLLGILAQILKYWIPDFAGRDTLVALFNLDAESNIPTWFSSSLMLMCSAFLLAIAAQNRKLADGRYWYWMGLCSVFLLLSIDEAAMLHERFLSRLSVLMVGPDFPTFGWVLPGALVVFGFIAVYWKFVLQLDRGIRRLVFTALILLVIGAVGVESIGGYYEKHLGYNIGYGLIATLEETLEMSGAGLFLYALWRIADASRLNISIDDAPDRQYDRPKASPRTFR